MVVYRKVKYGEVGETVLCIQWDDYNKDTIYSANSQMLLIMTQWKMIYVVIFAYYKA